MSDATTSSRTVHRRFGTLLSVNSPPRSTQKRVRVRNSISYSPKTSRPTYSVTFEAGVKPLGLQMEPYWVDYTRTGCRLQKFNDNGPQDPGPARAKGCMTPGDVVISVNGQTVISYEHAITMLKESHRARKIVMQRNSKGQTRNDGLQSTPTKSNLSPLLTKDEPSNNNNKRQSVEIDTDTVVALQTTSTPSTNEEETTMALRKDLNNTQLLPPTTPNDRSSSYPVMSSSPFSPLDVSLIQSADDLVLLSSTIRQRRRANTFDTSPTMSMGDTSHLMPVEEMLQHDFASHYLKQGERTDASAEQGEQRSHGGTPDIMPRKLSGSIPRTLPSKHSSDDESERDSLKQENARLLQELSNVKAEISKLERQNRESDRLRESAIRDMKQQAHSDLQEAVRVAKEEAAHELEAAVENTKRETLEQSKEMIRLIQEEAAQERNDVISRIQNEAAERIAKIEQDAFSKSEEEVTRRVQAAVRKAEEKAALEREAMARECKDEAEKQLEKAVCEVQEQTSQQLNEMRAELSKRQQVVDRLRLERDGATAQMQQFSKQMELRQHRWREELLESQQVQQRLKLELDDVKSQLSSAYKASHTFKESIQSLELQIQDLEQQRANDQEQLTMKCLQDEELRKTLSNDAMAAHAKIDELTSQLRKEQADRVSLQFNLDREQEEKIKVEQQLVQMKSTLLECQRELSTVREAADQLRQENETLQSTQSDLSKLRERFNTLQEYNAEQKDELQKSIQSMSAQHANETDMLNRKLQDLEQESRQQSLTSACEIDSLRSKILALETTLHDLESDIKSKTDDLTEATKLIELMESQLEGAKEEIASRRHQRDISAESSLASSRIEIAELKRLLEESNSRLKLATQQKQELAKLHSSTLERLETEKERGQDTLLLVSKKNEELMSLQHSLETKTTELNERSFELKTCKQMLSLMERESSILSRKLKTATETPVEQSASLADELISAQSELADIRKRSHDLQQILKSMTRNLSDSERRASLLREQLDNERSTSKELRSRFIFFENGMNKQIEEMKSEVSSLHEKNIKLETDRNEIEKRKNQLEEAYDELKLNLSEAVRNYEGRLKAFETDRVTAHEYATRQKGEISDLSERLRVAKSENEEAQRQMCSMRRQHADEMQNMKQEYSVKLEKQGEALRAKEQELRCLNKLKEEARILRGELSTTEKSLKRSREECDFMSALLDEVREDCSSKLADLKDAHADEMRRLETSKIDSEEESRGIRQKIASVEDQLRVSQEELLKLKSNCENLYSEKFQLMETLEQLKDEVSEKDVEMESLVQLRDSSCDGQKSPFFKMSRKELTDNYERAASKVETLQLQCTELQESLSCEETRGQNLERHCKDLSDEINKLVFSNVQLEEHLQAAIKARDNSEGALSKQVDEVKRLSETLRVTREKLSQNQIDMQDATCRANELQMELNALSILSDKSNASQRSELARLKTEFDKSETSRNVLVQENKVLKASVASAELEIKSLNDSLNDLRNKYEQLSVELKESHDHSKIALEGMSQEAERYLHQIEVTERESAGLRAKVSDLECHIEKKERELTDTLAKLQNASQDLDRMGHDLSRLMGEKEDAESTLKQSMQQAKAFKDNIQDLENQLDASDRSRSLLTSQLDELHERLSQNEQTSQSALSLRSEQLQVAEEKISQLEQERDQRHGNSVALRQELRELRRQNTDQQNLVSVLQNRVDSLSGSLENSKAHIHRAIAEKEAAVSTNQSLKRSLESTVNESEQLRARVQVLNASLARMKSECSLLQDSVAVSRTTSANPDPADQEEIARLQSKIQMQEAKLSSLSDVYKSQQQVLSLSQSLEGQLLQFVENTLQSIGGFIASLGLHVSDINQICSVLFSYKDDVAEAGLDRDTADRLQESLDSLSTIIPQAESMLKEKHEQLGEWKKRRTIRVSRDQFHTPSSKSLRKPDSPSVLQALDKMKQVLNDEILSPHKPRQNKPETLEASYLQKIVNALESQIDKLLSDLQSTNEALKAKDQLFYDMEQIVAHHESERNSLEKKLERALEALSESKLQGDFATKSLHADMAHSMEENSKLAAGLLIANFLESRDTQAKAVAFRQWSSTCLSRRVKADQEQSLHALSLELERTREKFFILKRHLKKSRRGKAQMQPALDRILEDDDTAE